VHSNSRNTANFAAIACPEITFPVSEDDFEVRPGRVRDRGRPSGQKAKSLVGRVLQVSKRAGYSSLGRRVGRGTGRSGRGRSAALAMRRSRTQRRVIIKARVVRQKGAHFRAAPLARHLTYLKRDGVDREGSEGRLRGRAEERVTAELGRRTEREIAQALRREVSAERWTSLDRSLQRLQDDCGLIDLRPDPTGHARSDRALLIGRATALERLGLADAHGPACWTLGSDLEGKLRALGERGDIIKTMHRAMARQIPAAMKTSSWWTRRMAVRPMRSTLGSALRKAS
jgi:hypothetical protein